FLFTKAIVEGKPIKVFNNGEMKRDFTYIDDIVKGVIKVIDNVAKANPEWKAISPQPNSSKAPYKIYNIGNSKPVNLMDFIECIEKELNITAQKEFMPLQPGDVVTTWADTTDLEKELGYHPSTEIEKGIKEFVRWYCNYHKSLD